MTTRTAISSNWINSSWCLRRARPAVPNWVQGSSRKWFYVVLAPAHQYGPKMHSGACQNWRGPHICVRVFPHEKIACQVEAQIVFCWSREGTWNKCEKCLYPCPEKAHNIEPPSRGIWARTRSCLLSRGCEEWVDLSQEMVLHMQQGSAITHKQMPSF